MSYFSHMCDELGEKARKLILPFFKEQGWTYMAGNGTWFICKTHLTSSLSLHERIVEDDDLPKWLRDLLWIEFDRGNYLGYFIRDIGQDYSP